MRKTMKTEILFEEQDGSMSFKVESKIDQPMFLDEKFFLAFSLRNGGETESYSYDFCETGVMQLKYRTKSKVHLRNREEDTKETDVFEQFSIL